MRSYLNLGCGKRFHSAWTNVDNNVSSPFVIRHDLLKGIPFPDDSFDVVYHSHLLEHFPRRDAAPFLRECYRVLKRRGIIRIVVPDLERIARLYLQALEAIDHGRREWGYNYEWILLELYDQTIREKPGGEMSVYLSSETIPNREFVLERMGVEGRMLMKHVERGEGGCSTKKSEQSMFRSILRRVYRLLHQQGGFREAAKRLVLGNEYELLELGRFRRRGEIHFWMYDRYSATELLQGVGFEKPEILGPAASQIVGWKDYDLDTEPDGTVYKPDSLYIEAVKPQKSLFVQLETVGR